MSKNKPVRIEVSPDKQSITSRTERGGAIAANAPNADLWKAHPSVVDAGNKVIAATTALTKAHAASAIETGRTSSREMVSARELPPMNATIANNTSAAMTGRLGRLDRREVRGAAAKVLVRLGGIGAP